MGRSRCANQPCVPALRLLKVAVPFLPFLKLYFNFFFFFLLQICNQPGFSLMHNSEAPLIIHLENKTAPPQNPVNEQQEAQAEGIDQVDQGGELQQGQDDHHMEA